MHTPPDVAVNRCHRDYRGTAALRRSAAGSLILKRIARKSLPMLAMFLLLVMNGVGQAANFAIVPAVSNQGVLIRFMGTPAEATPRDPAFRKGFIGYGILRDGQGIGTALLTPDARTLLALRESLYSDADWKAFVAQTNEMLKAVNYNPSSDVPAEWFSAVMAAPAIAQALELRDWRAAVLLGRAYLDTQPPAGVHTYEFVGLEQGLRGMTSTFQFNGVGPIKLDTGAATVVAPPRLWNLTPTLALGLPFGTAVMPASLPADIQPRRATGVPPDGVNDPNPAFLPPGGMLHPFQEKAHLNAYLKFAPPPLPLLPVNTSPGPRYIAFGYNVERAPAEGATLNAPPAVNSPLWQQINAYPVLILKNPPKVPETPPPAVLEALKAEITDEVAHARIPGPESVETKKTTLALQNWTASRNRPTADTFRNTDFDFVDRGALLSEVGLPKPEVWGPKVMYWYRILGLNGYGFPGEPSPPIRVRPYETYRPMAPRNLKAKKTGSNRITLQWEPPASPPADAKALWNPPAGYRVYRWKDRPGFPGQPAGPSNPGGPGVLMATLPASATSVDDTGQVVSGSSVTLQEGTTYWYRIVTIDAATPANESLPSGSAWGILYDESAPGGPPFVGVRGQSCGDIPQTNVPGTRGQATGGVQTAQTRPKDPCDCPTLFAEPVRGEATGTTGAGTGGSAYLTWGASPNPDVVGYLVYRASSKPEPESPCGILPGELEYVEEVRGTSFIDPFHPTDATPVFYAVRAMDKDRNLSPPVYFPAVVVLSGSQTPPEPGFVQAKAEGPETPPGPWKVNLTWDASVPEGSYYQYQLWRAQVNVPKTAALPGGLPAEADLQLLVQGQTGDSGSFFPASFVDTTVSPGPDNLPTDYWYVLVLKDPTGKHPDVRSKTQYVKVGGDVLEPEHKILPFPWELTDPVQVQTIEGKPAVQLRWQDYHWQKLSWVDPSMSFSSVRERVAQLDTSLVGQARGVIDYAVLRSATGPDGNFRQVSPLTRLPFWWDSDVNDGKVYHYQILAFDPVTKELIGFTDTVKTASLLKLTPLPPVFEVPIPNVTFFFDLKKGETAKFPVALTADTLQAFTAEGQGSVTLGLTSAISGQTLLTGSKKGAMPLALAVRIHSISGTTYELQVTAEGGPAKGKVTRTASPLLSVVVTLAEAIKALRASVIGAKVTIPQPDGTLKEVIKGDLTGDGKINVSDVVLQLRATVGLIALDEVNAATADTNADNKLNIGDVIRLLRFAVGLTS